MESRTLIGVSVVSVALCLLTTFPGVRTHGSDITLTPGSSGRDVVEAVVGRITSSCIFDDDKEYIKRVAYVESTDGAQPKTYRAGNHGGIWQVDEAMFNVTLASTASYIQAVNAEYNIDWAHMAWTELRKPLCSGLAARIYTEERRGSTVIPRPVEDQGDFYADFYRSGGDADVFTSLVDELDQKCKTGGADVVFVLDVSGSIGIPNFDSMLTFVQDVVTGLEIAENATRISVIRFSSGSTIVFNLNSYFNKAQLIDAVANIAFVGGGTNTAAALNQLVDEAFLESNGGRPLTEGFPRVGIVVTDGISNDEEATMQAAAKAHAADITMFAIGVGDPNPQELDAIATDPDCLHKFFLSDFSEFATLSSQIKSQLCNAPVIFHPNNNVSDCMKPGESQNCKLKVPREGVNVQIETDDGKIVFYIARGTYPSNSYYTDKVEATPGKPALIYVGYGEGGDVFCNYEAINITDEECIEIMVKPAANVSCPDGCIEFNRACYFVSKEKTSFANASTSCHEMKGYLASVLTPEENQFLADNKVRNGRYWIGLNRDEASDADGDWSWVDGSPYSWTNWAPKNLKMDTRCAVITRVNGIWLSVDCDKKTFKFICKKIPPGSGGPTFCHCDAGWLEYSGSCYWFSEKGAKKGIKGAVQACVDKSAEIPSIQSEDEHQFILDNRKTTSKDHWLGMNRTDQGWAWSNGDVTGYTNWYDGQPSSDYDCSLINRRTGLWKATSCRRNNNMVVCRKSC